MDFFFFFFKEGVLIRTAWKCKKSEKTWDSCEKDYEILLPSEISVHAQNGMCAPVICLAAVLMAHLLRKKIPNALRRKQNSLACFKRNVRTKGLKLFQIPFLA